MIHFLNCPFYNALVVIQKPREPPLYFQGSLLLSLLVQILCPRRRLVLALLLQSLPLLERLVDSGLFVFCGCIDLQNTLNGQQSGLYEQRISRRGRTVDRTSGVSPLLRNYTSRMVGCLFGAYIRVYAHIMLRTSRYNGDVAWSYSFLRAK